MCYKVVAAAVAFRFLDCLGLEIVRYNCSDRWLRGWFIGVGDYTSPGGNRSSFYQTISAILCCSGTVATTVYVPEYSFVHSFSTTSRLCVFPIQFSSVGMFVGKQRRRVISAISVCLVRLGCAGKEETKRIDTYW